MACGADKTADCDTDGRCFECRGTGWYTDSSGNDVGCGRCQTSGDQCTL